MTHNGDSIHNKFLLFIKDWKEINSSYYLLKMFVSCLSLCLSNWKRAGCSIVCSTNANINVSVHFFLADLIISLEMDHSYKIITGKWNQLYCIDKVYCLLWNHLKRQIFEFHSGENWLCSLSLLPNIYIAIRTYFVCNMNRILYILEKFG